MDNKYCGAKRILISWMLTVIMLCVFALGGMAESAEPEEQNMFSFLLEKINENPAQRKFISENEADEYCHRIYNYFDEETAKKIFYADADGATELLKRWSKTLYETDRYADVNLENAELFYVLVWDIMHNQNVQSRPIVKEIVKDEYSVCSEEIVIALTDECMDYIEENEPEISNGAYIMYGKKLTGKPKGDAFSVYFYYGYQKFEEGKYEEAINYYTEALRYKEDNINTRFEIAEAYIMLRDYENARAWLSELSSLVKDDKDKAKCLRRYGFIEIEELDYEMGAALYTYSLKFEESSRAREELDFINLVAPDTRTFTEEEAAAYIKGYGISFLE